jgi:hypothetical protein
MFAIKDELTDPRAATLSLRVSITMKRTATIF